MRNNHEKIEVLTEKQWLDILHQIYSATLNGVPKVTKPVTKFAIVNRV